MTATFEPTAAQPVWLTSCSVGLAVCVSCGRGVLIEGVSI
jgi:hypothetical protein